MSLLKPLTDTCRTAVRFSEVDALGIVWHGNYVKYLEDGRESFGRHFSLGYTDVYAAGLLTPVVKMEIDYKQQVHYGETLLIETTHVDVPAAKIVFNYRILRESDGEVVLTASTTQVFLNTEGKLELSHPEFYTRWRKRQGMMSE